MNNIEIEFKSTNRTRGTVTAIQDGTLLHSDVLDIAKDADRQRFIDGLRGKVADLDSGPIEERLLQIVQAIIETPQEPDQSEELDSPSIVRPHLFHTPDVSGLLVRVTRIIGNTPQADWLLCTQWSDGRRECLDMVDSLEVSPDHRIWFQPTPGAPTLESSTSWSMKGREKWLNGYEPNVAKLYDDLSRCYDYFLEFPEDSRTGHIATLSLWTMLSYAYTAWDAVPYLSVGGPLGSGKTQLFNVLQKLAHCPLMASNLTAPCLFRTLDSRGGTLLLDEAERMRDGSTETKEILTILLSGYKKNGGKALRLEKVDDTFQLTSFDVYGPKAIAAISELPPALTSRCIRILMQRAPKGSEKISRRIGEQSKRFQEQVDDLHAFALCYGPRFIELAGDFSMSKGMSGRETEVWQPMLALARLVETGGQNGLVSLIRKHADRAILESTADTVPEADDVVLQIAFKHASKGERFTPGDLLGDAKIENQFLFERYSAKGIGGILRKYGLTHQGRAGNGIYYRPTIAQMKSIADLYDIQFDPEDQGSTTPKFGVPWS